MTDKELLEFCKQHEVELSVSYDSNRDSYHLRMRRGWVQINNIVSATCIDTAKGWDDIVKYKLHELEEKLAQMERVGEEENKK